MLQRFPVRSVWRATVRSAVVWPAPVAVRFSTTEASPSEPLALLRSHQVDEARRLWSMDPGLLTCVDEDGYTPLMLALAVTEADVKRATAAFHKMNQQKKQDEVAERVSKLSAVKQDMELKKKHYNQVDSLVENMLELGADAHATDKLGTTALMYASQTGALSVCRMLVAKSVDMNLQDAFGKTSLIHAASMGHSKVAKLLIENGAQPNVLTFGEDEAQDWGPQTKRLELRPHTALDFALAFNHKQCADIIRNAGGMPATWVQ